MWETVVGGLVVAAVGGAVACAFRPSFPYDRLESMVSRICLFALLSIGAFLAGYCFDGTWELDDPAYSIPALTAVGLSVYWLLVVILRFYVWTGKPSNDQT